MSIADVMHPWSFCVIWGIFRYTISYDMIRSMLFIVRCYAERGIAMASCLSVCLSPVCNVDVRWSYRLEFLGREIISRLISLTFPLSADLNITDLYYSKGNSEHPQILAGIGVGYGSGRTKPAISETVVLVTIITCILLLKSYTGFRLPPKCMTLNDL